MLLKKTSWMLFLAATAAMAGDDSGPRLVLTGPTVTDGNLRSANFEVEILDRELGSEAIVVEFATVACSAEDGRDFDGRTGSLVIPIEESTATIPIDLLAPNLNGPREGYETFEVELSNVSGATIENRSAEAVLTDPRPIWEPTPGDLDLDGAADVWVEYDYPSSGPSPDAPKRVVVWYPRGTGLTAGCMAGELLESNDWGAAGVEDFDGDGAPDVLWWHPSGEVGFTVAGVEVPSAIPTCPGGHANVLPFIGPIWVETPWQVVGTGRFSGLGVDVVIFDPTSREIRLLPIDSHLDRGAALVLGATPDPSWNPIGTGDFDGNGTTDLLLRNTASGRHVIWFYDGMSRTGGRFVVPDKPVDDGWRLVGTGDYNGDGHADLLFQHQEPAPGSLRLVVWFLRNGERICGRFFDPALLDLPEFPGWSWNVVF